MTYSASSITVMENREAVRTRPGMYIGGTGHDGFHHLLWEIIDNSVDEAMNGHATSITVVLHKDGRTATVFDNGRGIPTDLHPKLKISALEIVFTTLHSGAKFDSDSYQASGGLHGVGASVVNFLSASLSVKVWRHTKMWVQEYRKGKARYPVKEGETKTRGTGTSITFTPDPEIFGDLEFDATHIQEVLDIKTYLHPGLKIILKDEIHGLNYEMHHEGGLADFLTALAKQSVSILREPFIQDKTGIEGLLRINIALTWSESPKETVLSFVNGIPTRMGGTHEQGFKEAIVKAVRNYADTHDKIPRSIKIIPEDIREGIVGIISVFITDPQFQGQVKDKLNNVDTKVHVDSFVRPVLEQWLHENGSTADLIVSRTIQASKARLASRKAIQEVSRKSPVNRRLNLPGKLADCSSTDPAVCELFIVEGDSAGGSAKQGRDRVHQAILPLRGKVLNVEQASTSKAKANNELTDLITALGCGLGKDFVLSRLRYHKVILLMDADSDGHHIATLLLTFFYRYLPELIKAGHVYIAQPPLYRIEAGKTTYWAADDIEKQRILKRLPARANPEIMRFKGLGEMMPKTLFETTLHPEKRRLQQVSIPEGDSLQVELVISSLMGKDPQQRYREIMERAEDVDILDV